MKLNFSIADYRIVFMMLAIISFFSPPVALVAVIGMYFIIEKYILLGEIK